MWNGALSPTLSKAVTRTKWEPLEDDDDPFNTYVMEEAEVDDAEFSSDIFDEEATLEIEDRNPGPRAKRVWKEDEKEPSQRGILWIQFMRSSGYYGFPCTYKKYLEFQESNFSSNWFNSNFKINHIGDWGWPWGRTVDN